MYFHTSFGDTLLFKDCVLNSTSHVIIACVIFFLIALSYEGLKSYRELLFRKCIKRRTYDVSIINPGTTPTTCPEPCIGDRNSIGEAVVTCRIFSHQHLYQSFLHVVQVVTSYALMLGFMSFNIWICLSITLGAGLGYFFFCWQRITIIDHSEHCN